MYSRFIYIISLILIQINLYSQLPCTVTNGIGCRCADSTQTDCDLLPDIQASWYGLLNVDGGPDEYPQTGAGDNNGRLRISVSTPNTGYGPLTVRGIDEDGFVILINRYLQKK